MPINILRFFNNRVTIFLSAIVLAVGLLAVFHQTADAGVCWTRDSGEGICCGKNEDGKGWCCTASTQEEALDAWEKNGEECHEQTDEEKEEMADGDIVDTDGDSSGDKDSEDKTGDTDKKKSGGETTEVDVKFENPITSNTLDKVVGSLIDFVFSLAVVICPIVIIIGGFIFVTASGDPKKVETGKKVIFWALVGLAVAVLAKGSILLLRALLGVKK